MSDTSEYTVVGDGPSSSSYPDLNPDNNKSLENTVNMTKEMLSFIRKSILDTYKLILDDHVAAKTEEEDKRLALQHANILVDILEGLGGTIALLPEQGYDQTTELLVSMLVKVSATLAADGDGDEVDEEAAYSSMCNVLTHRYTVQLQLLVTQSNFPAHADVFKAPLVRNLISNVLDYHAFRGRFLAHAAAKRLKELLPKYAQCLTAVYGCAGDESRNYVEYARSVVKTLDRGKQEEGQKEDQNKDRNVDQKVDKNNTAWYWPWKGRR
ncbi:hypothetical protein SPBR_06154 [Sporothrix brasiliensis 5110]|uniref:Uncharacterized protein n=1 Tax=Sporothrix brasiliensis 5110 TaxID=1398154 RepID=A0A0C2JCA8_9PEZI|nr:uncharacterized protein SPBR_06154 [Sporothrix brasiliensis 5110]KIH94552.1 hypothetical protein SPBR_06154 [Sporothrix brasiliensis 5110]